MHHTTRSRRHQYNGVRRVIRMKGADKLVRTKHVEVLLKRFQLSIVLEILLAWFWTFCNSFRDEPKQWLRSKAYFKIIYEWYLKSKDLFWRGAVLGTHLIQRLPLKLSAILWAFTISVRLWEKQNYLKFPFVTSKTVDLVEK